MSQGTILNYLPQIQDVVAKIPTDHIITRTEIEQLDVESMKIAFHYTFPSEFSYTNYRGLDFLYNLVRQTMNEIPDHAIVIASGDSPSKVVALINLLWMIDEDTYTSETGTKRIKFVTFPISGLRGNESRREQVQVYLKGVLDSNQVDYSGQPQFYDLDFIDTGRTHDYLSNTLRSLNPAIKFVPINLDTIMKRLNLQPKPFHDVIWGTITEAEVSESRCVPKYTNLSDSVPVINIRRCNMIIIMTYLKATNKLGRSIQLPSRNPSLDSPGYYDLEYYDFSDNEQKTVLVYKSPNSVEIVEPDGYDFPLLPIVEGQVIKATRIPDQEIYGPQKFDPKQIKSGTRGFVTLVNGLGVNAVYNGDNYRIGNITVKSVFVRDFKPFIYIQTIYPIIEALLEQNKIQDYRTRSTAGLADTLMEFEGNDAIYIARVRYENRTNEIFPPLQPQSYYELLEQLIQKDQLTGYQMRDDIILENNQAIEFKNSQGYIYLNPVYIDEDGQIYPPQ